MAEHRIRLRGPWDRQTPEGIQRESLPATWPLDHPSSFRLIRKFGRPPIEAGVESIRLELLGVPGLVAVHLNDQNVSKTPTGPGDWIVPLVAPLLARNLLVLEVDLDQRESPDPVAGWGTIALVLSLPD